MGNPPIQPNTATAAAFSQDEGDARALAFANGSLVGDKYLVERTLAEGGIGIIVLAKHVGLDQRVVIKYLKPRALENPSLVERFEREARLAARISSDHVVRVFDVGVHPDGGPFMVMEYLVGQDLGSLVQSGPLPVSLAVDYVIQACDALAEAHALKIVHRDIKPENLFLAQRPSNTSILKIIDFGISKVAPTRDQDGRWAHETAADERFGTPLYMSPEQLRSSSQVDTRTDIWSLGVTLHELLTGQLPFVGEDLPQLCASVLAGPPIRLGTVRADAPPLLEAILLRCLEKDPELRFDNVAELAEELAPFGLPGAAARAARLREVIRRGGESVRRPTRLPESIEVHPLAIEAARALGASASGEMRAVTATAVRVSTAPPKRRAVVASVAALGCIGALAFARFDRSSPSPGTRATGTFVAAAVAATPIARSETTVPSPDVDVPQPPASPAPAPLSNAPLPTVASALQLAPDRAAPALSKSAGGRPAVPPRNRRELFGGRQ